MAVTRSDVARLAGVSPAVVSYVLNPGSRPVAATTRERVEAAITELDYRPNAIASALRGGSTRSIGFLTPNQRNPFYAELAEAVERRFNASDYLVLAGHTNNDRSREEAYLRAFIDRRIDALVLSSGVSLVRSAPPVMHQLPVVVLEETNESTLFSSIGADEAADAATAVEHLQRHGHALIGCIGGPPWITVEDSRVDGWRQQQRVMGLAHGDELIAVAEQSEAGGDSAASLLLSERGRPWALHGRRPSALFVTSDAQATGAIFACHELGLRVPEDVAIVSFGGTAPAAYTMPPLTTLRQDIDYLATATVTHLCAAIADAETPRVDVTVRGNLVIGRSCGCRFQDGENAP